MVSVYLPSAITASSGGRDARVRIGMEALAGGKSILGVAIVEACRQPRTGTTGRRIKSLRLIRA